MSDLLDSVRAVNPVPWCDQPSIDGVWSRLHREDAAASDRPIRRPVWSSTRWRGGVVASMMAAVAAATVVLVGAAIVRSASRPETQPSAAVRRLADGTISCDFTSVGRGVPAAVPVSARGRSAIVVCRNRYRAMERGRGSGVAFIACQTSATNVAVYIADGRPGQCGRLGQRALPAGYAGAVRQTRSRPAAISNSDRTSALSI